MLPGMTWERAKTLRRPARTASAAASSRMQRCAAQDRRNGSVAASVLSPPAFFETAACLVPGAPMVTTTAIIISSAPAARLERRARVLQPGAPPPSDGRPHPRGGARDGARRRGGSARPDGGRRCGRVPRAGVAKQATTIREGRMICRPPPRQTAHADGQTEVHVFRRLSCLCHNDDGG